MNGILSALEGSQVSARSMGKANSTVSSREGPHERVKTKGTVSGYSSPAAGSTPRAKEAKENDKPSKTGSTVSKFFSGFSIKPKKDANKPQYNGKMKDGKACGAVCRVPYPFLLSSPFSNIVECAGGKRGAC